MVPDVYLDVRDRNGNTPLHLAIQKRLIYTAMRMLESGCNVNIKNRQGDTPLMDAVRITGWVSLVDKILESGADINEQNVFGHSALCYSYYSRKLAILDLLMSHGADHRIRDFAGNTLFMNFLYWYSSSDDIHVEFQKRIIDFEADMNEVNNRGISTLFLAIDSETPLVEEIISRGADVNYFHGNLNALYYALRTSNANALRVILPLFDYQSVFTSYSSKPILAEFFRNRFQNDWWYRFHTIVSEPTIVEHAVQHYTFHDQLPPLIAQVIRTFAKYNFDEPRLFCYVCALLSYGARVLVEDIEAVYICYSYRGNNNNQTLDFLLDMDVDTDNYRFLSRYYVMLEVNKDVNSIFNEHMFSSDWKAIGQQFIFLPKLFDLCTPTVRFMIGFIRNYEHAMLEYIRNRHRYRNNVAISNMMEDIVAAYNNLGDALQANMCFIPSLIELSRNAARKAICLRYNIEGYSEYRRLLRNFVLPLEVEDTLLFKESVNSMKITLPRIRNIHDYKPFCDIDDSSDF